MAQHTDLAAFWTACKKDYFCQEAGLRSAPWRCAPDRIAPGTAAGSSPQESWHGAKLKKLMTKRNLTPFELAQSLHQEVVLTYLRQILRQLRNMERRGEHFQDWPDIATHLDQHILKGAKVMAKQGRTDAVNLLAWKKHRVWEDAQGNFLTAWSPLRNGALPAWRTARLPSWSASLSSCRILMSQHGPRFALLKPWLKQKALCNSWASTIPRSRLSPTSSALRPCSRTGAWLFSALLRAKSGKHIACRICRLMPTFIVLAFVFYVNMPRLRGLASTCMSACLLEVT